MVHGLNKFIQYFQNYSDNYVIIGGAACMFYEEKTSRKARATKDIDMIVIVENMSTDYAKTLWKFIKDGKYSNNMSGVNKNKCQFFRFSSPQLKDYPQQLELFSRTPDTIEIPDNVRIIPMKTTDGMYSLSAILMDDDYYNYTIEHSYVDNEKINYASRDSLICMKCCAYNDLMRRKDEGEQVDSRDIKKHRGDIFRMLSIIGNNSRFNIPQTIQDDIDKFIKYMESPENIPSKDFFDQLRTNKTDNMAELLLNRLKNCFVLNENIIEEYFV